MEEPLDDQATSSLEDHLIAKLMARLVYLVAGFMLLFIGSVFLAGGWASGVDYRLDTLTTNFDRLVHVMVEGLDGRLRAVERKVDKGVLEDADRRINSLKATQTEIDKRISIIEEQQR